ncbi:hypothetical protein [Lacicoccus alkaliphilus]|uniref:Uncharacterized protein n=1 Tax=Lacicoccus alkaliphilus DSM 16010 TaxID=1123231 RepID=A0A1M7EAN3_9BACL|nr:hypothetical protein [Salinicoccus alkaliphilus]SHL88690.1 hypothetical protein SAMN02745189_01156 [Salinicoccus alkaliphilus DSM 16010]
MIIALMLLIYLVIGYSTVMIMRSRALDAMRLISGVAFLLMILVYSLSLTDPDSVIVFVLGLSLMLSIEIAAFKETRDDRDNVFLVYAFTAMFAAVLIIMVFMN